MKLAKEDLLAALRLRYDHYSAQSIFETTIARAPLPDQAEYDAVQLTLFRATLTRVGDRLDRVDARIDSLLAAPAPVAAAPEPAKPVLAPGIHETTDGPKPVETTITLTGIDAKEGDQLLVCGGFAALGNWDPDHAAAMKRDGMHWRVTITIPPKVDAQFKFLHRAADGTVLWEDGHNRELVATPRIDATWQRAGT
jgi:Starch binding domain